MSKTGQMFFGEDFRYTQTQNFSFNIPGIDTHTPMLVEIAFGAKILGSTGLLKVYHNGSLISSGSNWQIKANTDNTYEFMKYITQDHRYSSWWNGGLFHHIPIGWQRYQCPTRLYQAFVQAQVAIVQRLGKIQGTQYGVWQ